MSFYEKHIVPALVTLACSSRPIARQRSKVVPLARGRVLEIGFGAGLNLPFYDPAKVEHLYALEPAEGMRRRAAARLAAAPFPVDLLDLPGEEIPLGPGTVDTVLVTYTLCTIPDVARALAGMARVLAPGGRMIFCEHGRAPDAGVRKWQERLNGIWGCIGGGCHLNRPIPDLVRAGGFAIETLDEMYLPRTPRFAGYNYWGTARPV